MELEEVYDKILPPQFDNTFKRVAGYAIPDVIDYDVPPSNPSNEYDNKYNEIHFTINSSNLLDPYSLILKLSVQHENKHPIQLDGSAHSLISRLSVYSNGKLIEEIKDYDLLMSLYFDSELTRGQRYSRRAEEGFGYNEYGTDEMILYPGSSTNDHYVMDENLDKIRTDKFDKEYGLSTEKGVDKFRLGVASYSRISSTMDIEDYKAKNYKGMRSMIEEPLDSCNSWNYVIDGKISPFPYKKTEMGSRNKYTFKIPLMLRSIGFGIPPNNYKLLPLEVFGALSVKVTLNPHAFFVPIQVPESIYFNIETNGSEYYKKLMKDTEFNRKYFVTKAMLSTKQLRFHPSIHRSILEKVSSGNWISDYIDMEILAQNYYLPSKNGPNITYARSIEKNNIKAFYIIFTNDLYKYTAVARKLARYNKGMRSISFKQAGLEFPKPVMEDRYSINSHGDKNGSYYYEQYMNCVAKSYDDSGLIINRTSYHIDYDVTHILGLVHLSVAGSSIGSSAVSMMKNDVSQLEQINPFYDEAWSRYYKTYCSAVLIHNNLVPPLCEHLRYPTVSTFSGLIKQPACKTIYALNFEPTPGSGVAYKTSISTSFNIPFVIEMERIQDYHNADMWNKIPNVFFIQTILFETYNTIQLSPYGEYVKI